MAGLIETSFSGLGPVRRGKVRDIYDLGDTLLLVATDRVSAFDVILPPGIPGKGEILTRMSAFWFRWAEQFGIAHHLIATDVGQFPSQCQPHAATLSGRTMRVNKTRPLPVECVVRGYLSGSGWKEYQKTGAICGEKLPTGLRESDRLPAPIFTPSTKAEIGDHDMAMSFEQVQSQIGKALAERVREISLTLYTKAADRASARGVIIADTKMEFGVDTTTGNLLLIDELLTPDASRFWPKVDYSPGRPQRGFDKQCVRDYLQAIHWDETTAPPHLPEEIIRTVQVKYQEAMNRLVDPT